MIVVIADDLSGAAELAGVALRHGLSAEVQTVFSAETKADVVCVDADTRGLLSEKAAEVIGRVTERVIAAKPAWIFKKCDSVLRGSVLAEARAAACVAGKTRIVVIAANPSRGRVVRDGEYFVNGVPLHKTSFAQDPGHPRITSSVVEMLGSDLTGVFTPDVESEEDVIQCAATVDEATLPVGGADFFQALLQMRAMRTSAVREKQWGTDVVGDTVLVCGSAASWAHRRAEAMARGIPVIEFPIDVAAAVGRLQSAHRLVIGIGDGPRTRGQPPVALVETLAEAVVQILRGTPVTRVLSEGGATTAAVIQAMGWTRLEATGIAAPGVGALRAVGGTGLQLFVKPGSYAWPKEIWPPSA